MKKLLSILVLILSSSINAGSYNVDIEKIDSTHIVITSCSLNNIDSCEVVGPKEGFLAEDLSAIHSLYKNNSLKNGANAIGLSAFAALLGGFMVSEAAAIGVGTNAAFNAIFWAGATTLLLDPARESLTDFLWSWNRWGQASKLINVVNGDSLILNQDEVKQLNNFLYTYQYDLTID
ncbi:MAG: hypothetical protein HON90_04985 [Halobacteriovoraceae bacterium]|jgi:hypothetical protein|nr:hypothetical protein [Halobacteriovoraceae bacterium]